MKAFIDDHRDAYGVEPICKVLPIAPSTYYLHAARQANPDLRSNRAKQDEALSQEIHRVWDENYPNYGARKVWLQLLREGTTVARCTVERLMVSLELKGIVRGKSIKTTLSDADAVCPLDRVNRQFSAEWPNALWVADFTYVKTWQGFDLPTNAGRPWGGSEEDNRLLEQFDKGIGLNKLAKLHGRTRGAIAARLLRLGRTP